MDVKACQMLERIAVSSLEKCAAKLTRISAGTWSVAGARVVWRSMEEAVIERGKGGAGEAVYFEVKGEHPFTSMAVFSPADIEAISHGFLGFSFSKLTKLNKAQELLLSELGNIILNSFISAFSNALNRSFLPSAPKSVRGEAKALLEALWTSFEPNRRQGLVTVTMDLRCQDKVTRVEVISVLSESLEREVMNAASSAVNRAG